jgi:hypothetical protein
MTTLSLRRQVSDKESYCPDAAQPIRYFLPTCLDPQRTFAQELELDNMDIHLADHTFPSNDDAFAPAPACENESSTNFSDSFSANPVILPSQYEQADLRQVVQNSKYLTPQQQQQLHRVLSKHSKLFDGTLGRYPGESIHLDVDPSVPPHHSRVYLVPHSHMKLFKEKLDRLISLGVLESQGRSEWISGSFLIPKQDGTVLEYILFPTRT